MKKLIRSTCMYAFALYTLPLIGFGLKTQGGLLTYLIAGFILTLMMLIIRPVLNFISIPLNLMSMGMFSIVTNGIILYLLTVFVTAVQVIPFTSHRFSFLGIIVPPIHFNQFFALLASAMVLSVIVSVISWLTEE